MKQPIRLTESDLHFLVEDAVREYLRENEMEEGWLGDKWNQTKSAANTMLGKGGDYTMGQRFQNAMKNWNTQGDLNNLGNNIEVGVDG